MNANGVNDCPLKLVRRLIISDKPESAIVIVSVIIVSGSLLLIHFARAYQQRHQRKSEHLLNTKCTYLFCGSGIRIRSCRRSCCRCRCRSCSRKNAINGGHTAAATTPPTTTN